MSKCHEAQRKWYATIVWTIHTADKAIPTDRYY